MKLLTTKMQNQVCSAIANVKYFIDKNIKIEEHIDDYECVIGDLVDIAALVANWKGITLVEEYLTELYGGND